MKKYYVYRKGYNSANNSARDGGPETVQVAEALAERPSEAVQLAMESGVTVYNNQSIWAEEADGVDAKRKERLSRVKLFSV
jgi:hypothetical protein